jgi:cellulose synthase/poly-beta-1,6-N-acetylglucosamine synthase-like glycosyltransferase
MGVKAYSVEYRREAGITVIALAASLIFGALFGVEMARILVMHMLQKHFVAGVNQILFMIIVAYMLYSIYVYFLARIGQLERHRKHNESIDNTQKISIPNVVTPRLAILVPSYKEDPEVIRKTLLSAALLDYPKKQIVLLIDNPPNPTSKKDAQLLSETRAIVDDLNTQLNSCAKFYITEFNKFNKRTHSGSIVLDDELRDLSHTYNVAKKFIKHFKSITPIKNHEDDFFVKEILQKPAAEYLRRAAQLRDGSYNEKFTVERIKQEYLRLSRRFTTEIIAFERKQYVNLSHEPNKAMNLNSYIGLMGKHFDVTISNGGQYLSEVNEGPCDVQFSHADFIITLDADSILSPDYALKLIKVMMEPGNERIGVIQTPYSAFPGAQKAIERIAGATTDIQYLIHQGFASYNATFWVGANALLRKKALEEIATTGSERGFTITRFIQDRTVIEDTESSVDLVAKDWTLYNFPERLAYSATPSDFGSLLIQRRRWANGGLIIFWKFLRYICRRLRVPHRLGHGFMGTHYLTSLAFTNLGILVLLLLRLEHPMRSMWLPLAFMSYFIVYGRDLIRTRYRLFDLFRVYALNLLLVPVNLGGVLKSIEQIITDKRIPFGRTPKILDRTSTPILYLAASYGFFIYCVAIMISDIQTGRWLHAIFAGSNAALLAYGVAKFIGIRETVEDIKIWLTSIYNKTSPEQSLSGSIINAVPRPAVGR